MRPRLFSASLILSLGVLLILMALISLLPSAGNIPAWSVLPPLAAVALAFVTRKVLVSLFTGVALGAMLAGYGIQGVPGILGSAGLGALPLYLWTVLSDSWNLQVLLFVALILAMVAVMVAAGGLKGMIDGLARYARGPRSTQVVTVFMGILVFIDDYANTMVVGSTMRPVSDRHGVSREKLAFLVDATSAPIAGLVIISTWIGYEVGQFGEVSKSLQLGRDGYSMFFDALAYRFYCILLLIFIFINLLTGRDFGPMRQAQELAARGFRTGAETGDGNHQVDGTARVHAISALLPIGGLLLFLLVGLWLDGGGAAYLRRDAFAWLSWSVWRDVIGGAENNVSVLWQAASLGLLLAVGCALLVARLAPGAILRSLAGGLRTALLPMTILLLAWTLKATLDSLHTDQYLIAALGDQLSPMLFPAIVFLLAGITAFATGTSWGTMAILIPTAVPLAFALDGSSYGLVTIMVLGAVLDGAILGDHCSPISDTTIMSSVASGCDHIAHVHTQLPYALLVGAVALFCAYLPAALGLTSGWAILFGAATLLAVVYLMGTRLRPAGLEDTAT